MLLLPLFLSLFLSLLVLLLLAQHTAQHTSSPLPADDLCAIDTTSGHMTSGTQQVAHNKWHITSGSGRNPLHLGPRVALASDAALSSHPTT